VQMYIFLFQTSKFFFKIF